MNCTEGEWTVREGVPDYIWADEKAVIAQCYAPDVKANAHLIAAAPDLYEACKATDKYFMACLNAWAANDGKLVDNKGNAIAEADGLDELADWAALLINKALAKAEER